MRKLIISGGTGYIGRAFYKKFKDKYSIKILTRNPCKSFHIDELESCDILLNLAGEKIFPNRWTSRRKKILSDSRYKHSVELIQKANDLSISHYLQASATSFYSFSEEKIFSEDSDVSFDDNFSQKLVWEWESALKISTIPTNTVLRLGVVIGPQSNFILPLKYLYSFCLGGEIGKGQQRISWVHIDDVINIIDFLITKQINKSVNVTSPKFINNVEMNKAFSEILKRPAIFNLPEFFYKTLFGECCELLTKGNSVYPKLLLDEGYIFKYPDFAQALKKSL
jgi:uncharacterized protein (TIGR01777 family)|tara:strand:+ start:23234 stop:24076 length:843 start_codon:yes stop_codon:yes gene_type:complete